MPDRGRLMLEANPQNRDMASKTGGPDLSFKLKINPNPPCSSKPKISYSKWWRGLEVIASLRNPANRCLGPASHTGAIGY